MARKPKSTEKEQPRKQGARIRPAEPEGATSTFLAGDLDAFGGLPKHETASSIRRAALLQLQRSRGNAHVQRILARQPAVKKQPGGDHASEAGGMKPQISTGAAQGVVQRSLTTDMDQTLDIYGPIDHDAMLNDINAAPVAERRAALGNAALRTKIRNRFTGNLATTIMSALLEGSHSWKNPPSNDFFDYFVVNNGKGTVPNTSTMNCWESILYAAYMAGEIGAPWIVKFYKDALSAADPNVMIWSLLGWSAALPKYPAKKPNAGQLIFYFGGGTFPGHVALSMGGDDVMSLWNQPNNEYAVQRIKITDLAGTVYIGDPPW